MIKFVFYYFSFSICQLDHRCDKAMGAGVGDGGKLSQLHIFAKLINKNST
jgi:hypothetical protein